MYKIRNFTDKDLEFVKEHEFILWLQIQYCGDFSKENALTAVDENGEVKGVAALEYHGSWYCKCKNNMISLNVCTEDEDCARALVKGASDMVSRIQNENPDKNVVMISFVPDSEKERMQSLLHSGFCIGNAIPVLGCDISQEIEHYTLPDGVTIEEVGKSEAEIDQYLYATGLANDGKPDGKYEYMFRSGDESFKSFRAVCNGKTVGGITIWNIGDERGATENIFTIPEFRRKNIARELIATAFEELKNRNIKLATLSMLGDNANAMKLYQSIGYKYIFNIFMLRY